jgi:SNF2 family DNA or RNA helicase
MKLSEYFDESGILEYADWSKNVELKFTPKWHQITGLSQAAHFNRFGLFDEQGCGKTVVCQAWLSWLAGFGNKAIALIPPTLITQFYNDFFSTFIGIDQYLKIEMFRGTVPQRRRMVERWEKEGYPDIVLMSYQLFQKSFYTNKEIANGASKIRTWAYFKKKGYNVLACDEATILKNVNLTHKAVRHFLGDENESALLLMTGTPAENALVDLYGIIKLINPKAYANYRSFERLHVIKNPYSPFDNDIIGYKNKDLLHSNLYARGRRVEKKDVVKDLPPKLFSEILVELEPAHLSLYKKVANERLLEKDGELHDFTEQQKLRQALGQIVNNPHLYVDSGTKPPKNNMEETLFQLLDSIGLQSHKVCIFIYYKATADRLMDVLRKYNPALLNSTTASRRDKEIKKFLEDDSCRVLITQYRSGGYGLNLQSVCSHIIFYEPISVPGLFAQACDRVHRTGQTEVCNMYVLTPLKTVMTKIRNMMISKHEENKEVTMDTSDFKAEVLNGVDLVGEVTDEGLTSSDVVSVVDSDVIEGGGHVYLT